MHLAYVCSVGLMMKYILNTTDTHTFNLPTASATKRGALSNSDWSAFNNKIAKDIGATYTTNAVKTVTAAEYAALTPNAQTLYFIV